MRILISLTHLVYGYALPSSQMPFYLLKARSWRFGVQSVPSLNFGGSLVPHVQRQDVNPTVEDFPRFMSGNFPACNFCATINSFSNQFSFPTSNNYTVLEFIHWTCHSLSLPCTSTNTKNLSEDLLFKPVSFLEPSQFSFQNLLIFLQNFLENG